MTTTSTLRAAIITGLGALLVGGGSAVAQEPIELTATVVGVGPTPLALQAVADAWNAANPDIQVRVEPRPDDVAWQASAPSTEFAATTDPTCRGGGAPGRPELAGHERDRHARSARRPV